MLICHTQFAAFAYSCQVVYPSEYAYQRNSVLGSERGSANCRKYASGLEAGVVTEDYIHCDGTQLRLTDSDLGSEQYSSSDYYVWHARSSDHQLLFIFPTRVNLTTITLHYYSDIARALPKLRFYAVPVDFDIWNAPVASYSYVDTVAVLSTELSGSMNVSFGFYYNTKKVLLHKYSNSYAFALSEVEFCSCNGKSINYLLTSSSVNHDLLGLTADGKTPVTYTSSTTMLQTTTSSPAKG